MLQPFQLCKTGQPGCYVDLRNDIFNKMVQLMKNSNDLVSIHKVYDLIEAELIRSQLESAGIENFLKSDNAGGTLSYLTITTGIEIIVRKEDAERAYEIIQERQS